MSWSPSSSRLPIANHPSSSDRRPRLRRLASLGLTGLLLAQAIPALAIPATAAAVTAQPGTGTPSAPQPILNAQGPNLVQNPSFEAPVLSDRADVAYTRPTALPGWTLSGSANLLRCERDCPTKGTPWAAKDGAQSVDIAATSKTGTLTQAIATPIGHTFTLSFAYLPGPRFNDVKSDAKANVSWAGSKIALTLQDRPAGAVNEWKVITGITLPAAITSTTQLSFKGLAGRNFGFAIDSISVVDNAPVTPDPDQVAPPELYRAAPPYVNGGFDFTKVQVLGQTAYSPGTYQLSFYAAASCAGMTSSLAPIATWTLTKSAIDTTPIFVTDALSTTIPASTPFIAAKVTGPASAPGVAGKVSGFSNCVVYGPENDTWPRALAVSASNLGHWIDEPGIGRWFKVDVTSGGSVTVDLRSLPADYDVYLFKDIRETFAKLTTETDLVKLSAEFAGSGFSGSGFSGSGFSGSGFSGSGFSGSGFSADTFSGSGFSGSGFSGSGFSGSGFSGSGFSGSGFSGSGFSAEDFSAAQYYSLIGWSNNIGTADEQVGANTWTSTGDFYIRVNGKNGASSLASPFTIDLTVNSDVCNSVSPPDSQPPGPISNTSDALILTDTSRFSGDTTALATKLGALAAATNGTVVDFAGPGRVRDLQSQADLNPACVYAKNLVASGVKAVVDAYRAGNPGLKYIVLAGGDNVIPFFRYPDTSSLAPEANFYPPVKADSTSEAALRANYVLGQDGYGSTRTITVGPVDFPVPGIPVGRLVENQTEIIGMIDAYLGLTPSGGVRSVSPLSSLVTGYDFVADAAEAVKANLDAGTTEIGGGDWLIQPYGKAPTDSDAWSAAQLKTELLGQRNDITFLAGHFSANSALAADYTSVLTTADVDASTTNLVNTILFSIGCHSGYNTVDGDAIVGVTDPLDWAQVFARKGITSILGTGYQYGDTDFLEYSERIYSEFSKQLLYGAVGEPVAIGEALIASKIAYLEQTYDIADLHLKSLLESGLYGLPMLGVDFEHGRLGAAPGGGAGTLTLLPAATGLKYVDLSKLTPSAAPSAADSNNPYTKVLKNSDTADPDDTKTATWYSGSDGVQTEPGAPALPLYSEDVTPSDSNYVLRGVGFRGGAFQDIPNIVPLSGAPATELQTAHTSFNSPVFYPSQMWTPNYWGLLTGGSRTGLLMTPAQHKAIQPGQAEVLLRLYSGLDLRLFYINDTATGITALAPVINGVTSDLATGNVSARVIGDPAAKIHAVWVTYTKPNSSVWESFELERNTTDTAIWSRPASRFDTLTDGTLYMVQAVNGAGTVTVNDNIGAYYRWGVASTDLAPTVLTLTGPTNATYGTTTTISATLKSNGTNVDGQVILTLGSATRSGVTGSDGTVDIDLPVSSAAGSYSLASSFLGDATHQSSGASIPFTITKAASAITVTCPASVTYTGSALEPCTARVAGTTPLDNLNEPLVVSYSANTAIGIETATAAATFYGDAAHNGTTGSDTFTISRQSATLSLSNLTHTYDGSAKSATVTTDPPGLTGTAISYAGTGATVYGPTTDAPTGVGTYTVVASLDNPDYAAEPVTGTLTITAIAATMSLSAAARTPSAAVQFSDTVDLVATLPAGATGSVSFTFGGVAAGSATVAADGAANVAIKLDQVNAASGASAYSTTGTYTPAAGSPYTGTSASASVQVVRESQDADGLANGSSRIDYTGTQSVPSGTSAALAARLYQGLAPEAGDAEPVDFTKVTVNARIALYPADCSTAGCPTAATWTSADLRVGAAGTVSVNAPRTLAEGAYLVVVKVTANAFVLPLVGTSTLAVGATTGNYMNGGGTVNADSTSNAQNPAGAFGFNVRSGNSGPVGSLVYAYRMRMDTTQATVATCSALSATCRDVDVVVRSAPIGNFVPGQSTTYPKTAFVTGRAVTQYVDAADGSTRYSGYELTGGWFRLDATDFATNGTNDTVGLTLYGPDGTTVVHQAHVPANPISQTGIAATTNQVKLGSGNLTVKPK